MKKASFALLTVMANILLIHSFLGPDGQTLFMFRYFVSMYFFG